ncbi:charged multivesicular body protein 1b-like [Artemia franciscana]|uniref:charged multivesicular body protein 1b-like n=1 Tax=Artemia franciscana TaxID=6661 RepID=UPI0032DA7B69
MASTRVDFFKEKYSAAAWKDEFTICLTAHSITQSMVGVVKSVDSAMKSMNLEKISGLMDKFESQFEDFDVQSSYMERTMSQTTTVSIPQSEVDTTIMQVANEAGLDLKALFPVGETSSIAETASNPDLDELTERLARLRQNIC